MRIRYAEIAVIFIGLFSLCEAARLRMTSQRGCIKEVLAGWLAGSGS